MSNHDESCDDSIIRGVVQRPSDRHPIDRSSQSLQPHLLCGVNSSFLYLRDVYYREAVKVDAIIRRQSYAMSL